MSEALDAGRLFEEHHEALFRYLVRLSNDEEAARDAVQHAFLRLLQTSPDPMNVKAWLFRVGGNAVRQWGRSRRRRAELVEARAEVPGMGGAPPDPQKHVEVGEARTRLAAVLARLTERERTLLLMREEGFTHREIAEAVGTTTGSVGTMTARALRKAGRMIVQEAAP